MVFISIVALAFALGITYPHMRGLVSFEERAHAKDINNLSSSGESLLHIRPLGDPIADPIPNTR